MGYFSVLAVTHDLDQSHRRGRFDGVLASHTGVISDGLTSLLRRVHFILSAIVIGLLVHQLSDVLRISI